MKNQLKTIALAFSLAVAFGAQAQGLKTPVKSPFATVKQNFGLSEVSIEYCRPSVNNRVIFGGLEPFDSVWRTGANASTKITFGEDVKINGNALKAGTYSLFTIPGKDNWTFIFNKNLTLWGAFGYTASEDVLRVQVKRQNLSEKVETLCLQFSNLKPTSMNLELVWENTKASLEITVEVDDKIMKNIETSMAKDSRPYFQSAQYYYDNKKDMKQALEWATIAFDQNPKAYWVAMLKGNIQYELGDLKGAKATAEQVVKLAKADDDSGYAAQGEELIKKSSGKTK